MLVCDRCNSLYIAIHANALYRHSIINLMTPKLDTRSGVASIYIRYWWWLLFILHAGNYSEIITEGKFTQYDITSILLNTYYICAFLRIKYFHIFYFCHSLVVFILLNKVKEQNPPSFELVIVYFIRCKFIRCFVPLSYWVDNTLGK